MTRERTIMPEFPADDKDGVIKNELEALRTFQCVKHDDAQDAAALGIFGVDFTWYEQRVDRNRRFINPEEAKKAYYEALQKVQATGQPVFIPGSPSVSIEARSHVNTKLEIPHDDKQDAAALAPPPTAGILGAVAAILHPELKDAHVEISRKPDVFRPTKAMLDILSERIDSDLNQRLTEFGKNNGFPVVFVFYQTLKDEDGVSKATCDIKMYKPGEKQDARLFAMQHEGEFGIFDPRIKDEQIKDLEKKVKRLEEDSDYWKRKAEGDDDDTLGIFKHWDE